MAQDGTTSTDNIRINLGNYQSNTLGGMKDFSVGSDSDPYNLMPTGYGSVSGGIRFGRPTCSLRTPQACLLSSDCIRAGGYWDIANGACGPAECPFGTTAEIFNPVRCRCNNDSYAYVERGNYLQSCPSQCYASPNKMYEFFKRTCACIDGYTMASNGSCNPNPAAAAVPSTPECWRELAEKATACETEANKAVAQCDPGERDSLNTLQDLLVGTSGSASENCERAATAGASGYHHIEDTRRACDEKINSCKTDCGDATTYLNANKERVYNACRERAYQAEVNAGPALPPDRFNQMWDSQNKASLDSQFQNLLTSVDSSRATCETGTAAKSREKLTTAMNDMNSASKSANQCVCQLGSTSADCKAVKGPADCSDDPTLPGCAKVVDNCFDPKNTSLKCICFRHPESAQCGGSQPSINVKVNSGEPSSFAGPKGVTDTRGNNTELSGMAAGKTTEGISNVGVGKDAVINAEAELAIPAATSGSAVSSVGNTNAEKPVASTAASTSGGNALRSANPTAPTAKVENGVVRKLGGFFDTAKSAIGGMFKKRSDTGETSDYRDGSDQNQGFDSRKFRPRGMVRGVASDDVFAGKHEDIWKVMNKQYKVQDQKDNFIFDVEKK